MDNLNLQTEINRKRLIEIIYNAKAGHTGGDLSCLNVLTALYFKYLNINPEYLDDPGRDRFVLSKGHCVEALYTVLEAKGILKKEVTDSLGQYDSPLSGHPTVCVPGIEVNTGALGHGLSLGVGMALAAKMDGASWRTFVLMGDGEQDEGSVYEAAMAGNHYKLSNLVAIIDRNGLQISGRTEEVMAIDDIRTKWTAFGWDVLEMNGDDITDICKIFESIDYSNEHPHLIISHSTKGFGVSFMENVAGWHHGVLTDEQYVCAIKEIDERIKTIKEG